MTLLRHEEACGVLGGGGGEAVHVPRRSSGAVLTVQAGPAPTGGRGGMDREVPTSLGARFERAVPVFDELKRK